MIYFIRTSDKDRIKIGFTGSDSPEKRMKQFQTGYPAELILEGTIPGSRQDEHNIHVEFKEYQISGEWFEAVPELLIIIKEMIRNQAAWQYSRKIRTFSYKKLDELWHSQIVIPTSIIDRSSYDDATDSPYENQSEKKQRLVPFWRFREERDKLRAAEARCGEISLKIRRVKRSIKAAEIELLYGEAERALISDAIAETEQEFACHHG